jgi:hypothetical protein
MSYEQYVYWYCNYKLRIVSLICSTFRPSIKCIKYFKKTQQMHFGCMNVILLYSDKRHVSATHVAIFRMVSASIQILVSARTQTLVSARIQIHLFNIC